MACLKGKESALDGEEIHELKMGKAAVGTGTDKRVRMENKDKSAVETEKTAAAIGGESSRGAMACLKGKESALNGEEIHELKMGKAAIGTGTDKRVQMENKDKSAVETEKTAAAIDDMIQTKKMHKEAVDEYDDFQTVKAESDPPAAAKHRIPDGYVRFILAMEREEPMEPEEYRYLFPHFSVEEARRKHEEETALCKRIYDDFEPFQAMVRKEWYDKGYVEVDYDFVARLARAKDVHKEDWAEWRKHQESLEYIEYADSDDEMYAEWYAPDDP